MKTLEYLEQIKESLKVKGASDDWLNPPATSEALSAAETAMGTSFPEEWRALYLRHDGEAGQLGLFLGLPWLPLSEVVSQWQNWKSLESDYSDEGTHFSLPPGAIREKYINVGWIPISHDWGGNHLGIDTAPGPEGRLGQFINFGRDEEIKAVIANTTEDLFRFLAQEIGSPSCQLEEPEEPLVWRGGESFMGVPRWMPLPLFHAQPEPPRPAADLAAWRASLPDPWPTAIANPEAFLQNPLVYLIRKGLHDLGPVAWCHKMIGLYIARNEVKDLSPLAGLKNLQLLHAMGNPIVSLEPLAEMPNLRILRLDDTAVSDLSPLASLPRVAEVSLAGAPITDLAPLATATSLQNLAVQGPTLDFTPLGELPQLEILCVSDAGEGMLESLRALKHLHTLEVQPAAGVGLDPLQHCASVRHLRLRGVKGAAMGWLASLTNLETIHLSDCELPDLDGLRNHPRLRTFGSRDAVVHDLSALTTCSQLNSVAGSYQQFAYLHDKVALSVGFNSINGGMSDEERTHWSDVNDQRRASRGQG